MLRFRKKEDEKKTKEIEEIKKSVERVEEEKLEDILPTIQLEKPPERPRFAPLFIKIERYREVLDKMELLKASLLNLRDIIKVSEQLDRLKVEAENLMQKNLREIIKIVTDLDKEFVKPKGFESETSFPTIETEKMGDYIEDLQKELKKLKEHLEKI
jgi:Asp-tRNA(Asn)/Glu-tRNA(Gln) amidotransferase C subunit